MEFVCRHSRMEKETLASLMMKPDEIANDIGSILDGEEAVRQGLIDHVGGLDTALECLRGMIHGNNEPA